MRQTSPLTKRGYFYIMRTVKQVLSSKTPYSKSTFKLKSRSDGRNVVPGNPKPITDTDKKIHMGHIIGSGQYNLDHNHDHSEELAFDYERLIKEKPQEADKLQKQIVSVLGPIFKRMDITLHIGGCK